MILLQKPLIFDVDVLGGVGLVVFALVAWIGIIAPVQAQQDDQRALRQSTNVAEAALQRAAERQRATEDDIRRLRAGINTQTGRAPIAAALPQFVKRVALLAEDYGLKVTQIVPQPARKVENRLVSDVQVSARGDLIGFARLLERLRRETPYFALIDYSISSGKDGDASQRAITWTLRLNMLPDESNR